MTARRGTFEKFYAMASSSAPQKWRLVEIEEVDYDSDLERDLERQARQKKAKPVDYSRWESIDTDSEDEAAPTPMPTPSAPPMRTAAARAHAYGSGPRKKGQAPQVGSEPAPGVRQPLDQRKGGCDHCHGALSAEKLRCAGCGLAFYCSRDCQKAAWKTHKRTCKVSRQA